MGYDSGVRFRPLGLLLWAAPVLALAAVEGGAAGPVSAPSASTSGVLAQQRVGGAPRDLLNDAFLVSGSSRIRYWNGPLDLTREFYFTRAFYRDNSWDTFRRFPSWSVDFPKADLQFLIGLKRLVNHLDAYDNENPIALTDPRLADFPFLYAVEVGHMQLSDLEVKRLRRYLLAGGFLFVDDFWGTGEWGVFERQIRRVLPEFPIVDIPLDHAIFHSFYDVEEIVQVPNVMNGRMGGPTWEKDGYTPMVRGIFDDQDRLLVAISFNCDLGDAWEWAEDPYYPLKFSTYAYQMGINVILYAMSH